ncbi:ABC-type branched-chain amino acid transport systems, ATPase component [Synechococcus sp. PCC 7502]|uniref:ABC transporter ATP-binding protein n=1 Tax=Synechococcus sp. PCC 7502 TaxID=1173263 RepID=UPI00029FD06A|nr:ABC transporter ATP-binding protein [Synechococcus sp. PCC 7502]AFY75295.1 ABC-type branched-chain amino acid transport systems, ATPase component [Synechococcus sp. PCC 7502]
MTTLLSVHKVSRRFSGLLAIDRVSFTVESGEIFGLIGPNGAGKTTMFNLITGLIRPSSGEIIYQDQSISRSQPYKIAQTGIARTFQNLRLFGNLSVLENVAIAHHIHTKSNLIASIWGTKLARAEEQEIQLRSYQLLELVGLESKSSQLAHNLPYGDQRRLELARALALRPQLLLLDEPAAGMNPTEKATLSDLIRKIRSLFNLTIIMIEHHVPLVMGLCDRIAVLDFGQLIALGIPEVVKNDPQVIAAYLGDDAGVS